MELFDKKKLKLFITEKFKVSSFRIPYYITWIRMYNIYAAKSDSTDNILTIRSGKGDKDRQTLLSKKTVFSLKRAYSIN